MKKLKPPSDGPGAASIISNDEKRAEFKDFREDVRRGVERQITLGRRIPQILADVGDELVENPRWNIGPVTRLEAVMRVVYEMALEGNLWCINFIADRTEGRPTQSVIVAHTTGDIREVPTEQLIAQRDPEAYKREVIAQAEQLLAAGGYEKVDKSDKRMILSYNEQTEDHLSEDDSQKHL